MKTLFSQFILLSYCLLGLAYQTSTVSTETIAGFLCTIIGVTLVSSLQSQKNTAIFLCAYTVAACFYPALYLFVPMLFFEIGRKNLFLCMIPFYLGAFYQCKNTGIPFFLFLCLGCLLALFLQYLIHRYEILEDKHKKTRDDIREFNLLLKERNQSLLEKQDYEIHNATLKERNRIAREIHDNVGHLLSRCILLNGAIQTINKDENCAESLQVMHDTLSLAMDNIRSSVHNLHDDSINLHKAVETLLHDFTFCPVRINYNMSDNIPSKIRYAFISIIKEALTNIVRHSNASHADITLIEHPAMYQLIIRDNGQTAGKIAAPEEWPQENSGIGLINMYDRVKMLGGVLQIRQKDGFEIFVSIPTEKTQKRK